MVGLLTRVSDVIHTLRKRVEALGLLQWEKTLEESLLDLSTATKLLQAQQSEAAVKGSAPVT